MNPYQEQIKRLHDALRIPRKGLEHPNPQFAETLFHIARRQNDFQEMKNAVKIVAKNCMGRWEHKFQGAHYSRLEARRSIFETAFRCAFEDIEVPKTIAHTLSPIMRIWAEEKLSKPLSLHWNLFESEYHAPFIEKLNLGLNTKTLHADLDTGLIAPGPRFPGQLVELSQMFEMHMRA